MPRTVSIAAVMADFGVAFGTSGARGLVTAMTDEVCFAYVCDFVPSPAVAAYGFAQGIPSLMVTGIHIPDDRKGIKFNLADGEVLKPDELAMHAQTVALPDLLDGASMLAQPEECGPLIDVAAPYAARYIDFFGAEALRGVKLGIYEHSAVGRDALARILEELGAEVVRLGRAETFIPADTEAVRPEDQALALDWARELGLDAILSIDGDSDRPLLADETGAWMRGDVLGILCAQALGIKAVATPVSCNSAVELCDAFAAVRRTRIGSPFVIEAMHALLADFGSVCGYEANGGFLLATPVQSERGTLAELPTRDAVLPMVAVLAAARSQGMTLGALQAQLPARYTFSDWLQNYPNAQSQALLVRLQEGTREDVLARTSAMFGELARKATAFDTTDGLRMTFERGDIIHLRPSGNAPKLRCYTESATPERAATLGEEVLEMIRKSRSDHPGASHEQTAYDRAWGQYSGRKHSGSSRIFYSPRQAICLGHTALHAEAVNQGWKQRFETSTFFPIMEIFSGKDAKITPL